MLRLVILFLFILLSSTTDLEIKGIKRIYVINGGTQNIRYKISTVINTGSFYPLIFINPNQLVFVLMDKYYYGFYTYTDFIDIVNNYGIEILTDNNIIETKWGTIPFGFINLPNNTFNPKLYNSIINNY